MSRGATAVVAGLGVLLAVVLIGAATGDGGTAMSSPDPSHSPSSPAPDPSNSPSVSEPATDRSEQVADEEPPPLLTESQLAEVERRWGKTVSVSVAPLDSGEVISVSGRAEQYAWSTIKILLVAQVLDDVGGPKNLDPWLRSQITGTLTWSDNDTAWNLHNWIKAEHGGTEEAAKALTKLIRRSGDKTTKVLPDWTEDTLIGLTRWDPADQAVFFRDLVRGCVLDKKSTKYLLDEMGNVADEQAWGLGEIDSPAFKGGWGSDDAGHQLTRQVGLVPAADGSEYVAAISVSPSLGSAGQGTQLDEFVRLEAGVKLIDEVTEWLSGSVASAPDLERC